MLLKELERENGRISTVLKTLVYLKLLKMYLKMRWMECRPCSIDQHFCHVYGNSKLNRYCSAGKGSLLSGTKKQ